MKAKAHIRVGYDKRRRQHQLTANVNPSNKPLTKSDGTELPTVAFAVEFEIPDGMFAKAEQIIATVTIPESAARVAADVRVVEQGQADA